jgi:hypothetical protein
MSSSKRARAILRAACTTLRRNPRLLWFAVLLGIASLVVTTIGAVLGWLGMNAVPLLVAGGFDAPPDASTYGRAAIGFGLLVWFGTHVIAPFFGVALASATLEALAHRPWSVRGSLADARRRGASIATYAVLDASVGAMLARLGGEQGGKKRRRRGHPLAAKLLGAAWWAATYLVVPVLARERAGGLGAVSRSTTLMRETWREAFVGRLVLGWLLWPAALLGLGVLTLLFAVGLGPFTHPAVFGVAAGIAVIGYIAIAAVAYTLDTVYRCALYVFATEGVVPEPFDDPDLHEIWTVRSEAP